MKYRLRCYLLGHQWIMQTFLKDQRGNLIDRKWEPKDYCIQCGLTKKEAGIIH